MSETIDVMLEGRLVTGHPMVKNNVTDKQGSQKVRDGVNVTSTYIGIAIPKNGSTDWKQTLWGQQIYNKGCQDWPNGEHGAPTFAWKIDDGDSAIPNRKGKIPNKREGWAGHWVVHCSTQFIVRCHHVGKYDPTQQIQNKDEIKTGDYCRVLVRVRGNGSNDSPGIYVNPEMFELSRAGEQIITATGPSAEEVFGAGTIPLAPNTAPNTALPVDNFGAAPQPPQAVPTAPAGPQMVQGCEYTYEQLKTSGWTDDQMRGAGYLV